MPAKKKETEKNKDKNVHKILSCCRGGPGPKYILKTLVGYKDHCHSKWREPAYTIGKLQRNNLLCVGPGPKYALKGLPEGPFYSFPKYVPKDNIPCTPGPYMPKLYDCSPKYTIQGKWKPPCLPPTSGPYDPYPVCRGPAYPFGLKPKPKPCEFSPPMYNVGPVCLTRECPPMFSITPRRPPKIDCTGPGPKYMPKRLCPPRGQSFGVKHSPCEADNRTPCDELC